MNIDLLRKAVQWAQAESEKEDSQWDQSDWARGVLTGEEVGHHAVLCGTSFCIAGWVCHEAGDRFVIKKDDWVSASTYRVLPKDAAFVEHVRDRAVELLGISYGEAELLFDGSNGIKAVERFAAAIAASYGETL